MGRATFLDGGGEMGALMRATDWARTPLGDIDSWPQSLRTTVSTCLNSRFPILIWWGREFVKLYNDAYREIISAKHPRALGRPGREVWPEIWHIIGPMLESVVVEGRATWSEDQFLPIERNGYPEECYFTFSYSPIHDETGGVGGVFSVVSETTGRVIGERRLQLLQRLATETAADRAADVCARAAEVLATDRADVPFALLYLADAARKVLRLAAATEHALPPALAPVAVELRPDVVDEPHGWPLARVFERATMVLAEAGAPQPVRAFVAPVTSSKEAAGGVLVAGVSPTVPVDDQYRGFAALIAREIGGSIARARALEDERRRAEALAEIDRAKTAFFANVSHEFRTPLTLLLGPMEDALAAGGALRGDELSTVHRNALRLLKLVNTLLDFARIEAGRAGATFEPIELGQFTAELASTFRSAMERAGLAYEVRCPPLPAPVAVDRDAWEKIVLNLLSNALKFTWEGGVTVSLDGYADRVELLVRDTGIGIPADALPRVFDRFHRVQNARARTHEGTGIGLALINELVKMHGGTIAVDSTIGSGTAFRISIPIRHASAADRAARTPTAAAERAKPYVAEALHWLPAAPSAAPDAAPDESRSATVLVVDDNADMRDYVARLLSDRWRVETAADGTAALGVIRRRRPDVVLSDVMMPRMDGFGLLQAIRSDPAIREIPVILLSARAGEEASIEGLAAGADDYIVKPFSARELRARVEAQVLRREIRTLQAAHDRRLADMFRHAPVAIALLRGPEHVFEFANDEYLSVIGRRDIIGRTLREALPELAPQGFERLLDDVYVTGQPYVAESRRATLHRGVNGAPEDVYFSFVYQPLRDANGVVDGIAVLAVDVSEIVRARHEAEAANRAKDQFLAILGHELRNPLAPILTATQLLEMKGPADPGLQKLRETIARQAHHMLKLVEDLLDVGRIITGKLRLEKARVELQTVVRQAIEASGPLIRQRCHTLTVAVPDAPLFVDGDAGRLSQVVCNLLNNAAKFTPDGGHIDLAVRREDGTAILSVRDSGIGLSPDMLDRVFDRFVQAGDGNADGLGIGLSVVKSIVELHGGTVTARSDGAGTGCEFAVALPVASPVGASVSAQA